MVQTRMRGMGNKQNQKSVCENKYSCPPEYSWAQERSRGLYQGSLEHPRVRAPPAELTTKELKPFLEFECFPHIHRALVLLFRRLQTSNWKKVTLRN